MAWDLVIVGGGIAGSSLALVMARQGASVLVLEQEERFRDRIRGESIHVWGTVDARGLGVAEPLLKCCAHELDTYALYEHGGSPQTRDLVATTPSGGKELTFYHPEMQQILIDYAQTAGATVWRGARVTQVECGDPPGVVVQYQGHALHLTARLVIGADGRRSRVRGQAGFQIQRDPDLLVLAGVLAIGVPADDRSLHNFLPPGMARTFQFIPLGKQRFRIYFGGGDRSRHVRSGGKAGLAGLFSFAQGCGVPDHWLTTMRIAGPLASFETASWWVDQPYRDGVALIGDAAAAPDPCFGNGLALALRDVRVLSEQLCASSDWPVAAQAYAQEHDTYFQALHMLEGWATAARYSVDPALQTVRQYAYAATRRGDAPDLIGRGPDQPIDDATRRRFLGY